jgi:ABC-type phosphate/phosphonate transport system ATPase subunit/ribosomal protein S18 acetylase RimI-like enzyme
VGNRVGVRGEDAWLDGPDGPVTLTPCYWAEERIRVGHLDLGFIVKEITEADEFDSYRGLTQHHYRDEALFGRTARLIVRNFHPLYPRVIGYIELTSPFYMNKARTRFLDAPFTDGHVSWDRWDMTTQKQHVHRIVRIARCVVYPEFRGLGLGKRLVDHACRFARNRWQAATVKPLFIEISADMLRFVPFAEAAGMTWIGETEGNLARVARDMEYLLRNRDRVNQRTILDPETHGIVHNQVNRMNRAAALAERLGLTTDELIVRLEGLASPGGSAEEVDRFRELLSLPKPTYIMGLSPAAKEFVHARAAALGLTAERPRWRPAVHPIQEALSLGSVTVTRGSASDRTPLTDEVQRAFSLSESVMEHPVLRDVSVRVPAGKVVLISGPSGSGKSTVLEVFLGRVELSGGTFTSPPNAKVGSLAPLETRKPLIEIFGAAGAGPALELLGWVGLSDAFVFLKRFDELSAGQQYRAELAALLSTQANVWIADEFCANLDPITANVVADRAQRLARRLGAVLVVATSQPENILQALRPDLVLQLSTATESAIFSGCTYRQVLGQRSRRYGIRRIAAGELAWTEFACTGSCRVSAPGACKGQIVVLRHGQDTARAVVTEDQTTPGLTGALVHRLGTSLRWKERGRA